MIPGTFDYHRPTSVAEAVSLKSSLGEDATVVAGGHSLIPMMKLRMAGPEHLIDLQSVDGLDAIAISGSDVSLGAMVTQADLIASGALTSVCPIISDTAHQIADPQVRNVGTIGGNVANGDPGNDMPALMMTLDADYVLQGPNGERTVKARDFYQSAYFTSREETEILTGIRFSAPAAGHGHSYLKQKRKVGDYATAAAAVILVMEGGKVVSASIGMTNVADTPLYAKDASEILIGSSLDDETIKRSADAGKAITDPAEDGRGPKDFRQHLAGVIVERAIRQAAERAS